MDARDICRRLNCSPVALAAWVERGCPIHRQPPSAYFEVNEVRAWLEEHGIRDWPKESDYDLDIPMRSLLKALARKDLTPWEAEKVLFLLGSSLSV